MTVTKAASIRHFQDVVRRIRKNSWFADTVLRNNFKFNISFKDGAISITEVPAEPFDSLLLNVRKLTQQKEPQNLLKIYRELKRGASDQDRALLDAWHAYWRLAFIKEPFLITINGSRRGVLPQMEMDFGSGWVSIT